jgi:glycosyltransferase involved in cell wall biosynthesis
VDVLHGHGLARAPLFALAARASGLPLIVTLHNLVPKLSLQERLAARAALSVAKKIICVSEAVSRSAAKIVPAHKRIVIYNGVELKTAPGEAGETILCMARLSQEKGIDVLIEAMKGLPDQKLVIAGDGLARENLEASSGPNVEFLGFVDDVPALLSHAAVLAVPSREEGLGLSALEAMAAGVPVVASSIGGLKEVVVHGETGLLIPPGDPAALADALKTLLADPERRRAMGEIARARICAKFSVEVMREKTRAVWEEAIE